MQTFTRMPWPNFHLEKGRQSPKKMFLFVIVFLNLNKRPLELLTFSGIRFSDLWLFLQWLMPHFACHQCMTLQSAPTVHIRRLYLMLRLIAFISMPKSFSEIAWRRKIQALVSHSVRKNRPDILCSGDDIFAMKKQYCSNFSPVCFWPSIIQHDYSASRYRTRLLHCWSQHVCQCWFKLMSVFSIHVSPRLTIFKVFHASF